MLIDFRVAMGNSSANLSELHDARRTKIFRIRTGQKASNMLTTVKKGTDHDVETLGTIDYRYQSLDCFFGENLPETIFFP